MSDYPSLWVKHPHALDCTGGFLYRAGATVCVDVLGRVGNGGIVAHDYRCNRLYRGCKARVLVAERTVRSIATDALPDTVP